MNRKLFALFFAIFLSACSSGIKSVNDEGYSIPKFVSQGYLDFAQPFDGCQSGDKVLVRNRQNNYFTCSETIPKLDESKVVLLQKDLMGTTKEKVFAKTVVNHACSFGDKLQFSGLVSDLREYLYNTRKGPYTLVKQELLKKPSRLTSVSVSTNGRMTCLYIVFK